MELAVKIALLLGGTSLDAKESMRSAHNLVLVCDYGFLFLNLIIILCVSSVLFAYGQHKGLC